MNNATTAQTPQGFAGVVEPEATGKHQIGEFTGMKRSDVEHVKALLSRQFDEARPAYGRMRKRQPRTFICVGTTNEDEYLVDETGNRRFLPIRCGSVDVEALQRDRDQLWRRSARMSERASRYGRTIGAAL